MLGRLKFEIDELVNEMLNTLPSSTWINPEITFCDLAMGGGQFLKSIIARLRAAGHSDSNIAARIFGFESNKLKIAFAINKHNLIGTFKCSDIFKEEIKMKFDIVAGNPPYQAENNVSTKLWPQFLAQGYDLLNANGILAFVVPTSWTQPLSDKPSAMNKRTNDIMFGNSLLKCDLDSSKYFNVGVDISSFILIKDGNQSVKKYLFKHQFAKIEKAIITAPQKDRFVNADTTVWGRKEVSSTKNSEFKFPICTKKGLVYSNLDDKFIRLQPKVIMPRDLGYYPCDDSLGKYGFYWQARAHCFDTTEEAASAFSFYNSTLVRWIVKNMSWVPQTDYTLLSMLKLPTFDRIWTDVALFAYYGLEPSDLE